MSKSLKLNIFQRGILQKAVAVVAYLGSIAVGAFILDWADKRLFTNSIKEAERQGVITPEALLRIQTLIETRDNTVIFSIIFIGLFCVLMGWFLMRWAAKLNWSLPVTIPQAVEFRSAMKQLGVTEPDERIDFARKHKVPIFLALSPLTEEREDSVRAQLYAFAHHSPLGNSDVFERNIGKQTLCLNAEDFEPLLEKFTSSTQSTHAARIVELEQNAIALKAVNSIQAADIAKLTTENEKLFAENADFRQKQRTVPGREEKAEKREISKIPFWRVAGPVINRLEAEAGSDTQYTRRDIQKAFQEELEKFPDLKPTIQKLLHTSKKEREHEPYSLEGWGMETIRIALGGLVQREGKRPEGS